MPSAPTIAFEVRPSRLLITVVAVMALLAMLAVAVSRTPWWLKAGICLLVAGYAWQSLRRHVRQPVRSAGWHGDGSWTLRLADGTDVSAELDGARRQGALIFLHFSWPGGGRASVALLPDNTDAETRRRLRMRLSALSDT